VIFPAYFSLKRLIPVLALVLLSTACLDWFSYAWAFGQNKLRTRDFQWQIFETEHFEIFYYPEEEALAREVCQIAEDAFEHDTLLLRYKPSDKTPVFIYRNQIDFQQTNISPSVIGVGTGGFTEAFKNRIALPAPASPLQLRQVIQHEFMHALQFDILYGEGMRSFRVYKGYLMPLWLIEGLAEYAAQDWDSTADMVVRDAVMHDRLIPLTLMDGFSHLEDVYLAYKESQLALIYIAEHYGEEKIGTIFNKFKNQISLSQILRETLGIGLVEFNQNFQYWARQKYWLQAHDRHGPEKYGTPVWDSQPGRPQQVVSPTWSPDGRYLAYLADYDQTPRIYLKPRSGDAPVPITTAKFEFLSQHGHPLAWSPDAKFIAFVARVEGKNLLYRLNVQTRSLTCDELPGDDYYSPAWSPDGKKIALAIMNNGISDIGIWDLETRNLTYFTRDRWADETPVWTPDGQALVYASERGPFWQLAKKSLDDPGESTLLTQDNSNHIHPSFSQDGRLLLYTCDSNGIYNLKQLDLSSKTTMILTNIRSGAFQPALSPDGRKMAFSVYEEGRREIYVQTPDTEMPKTTDAADTTAVAYALPHKNVNTFTALGSQPYHFRFSPDLLFLLAGYDSSQGFVGGGYLTASDYLGNHMVSLLSDWVPGYQARTTLSYGNFMFPVDLIFTGLYRRNYYRLINLETGTLTDEFNDQEITGGLQLGKPFSLYDRMEFEFASRNLQREHKDDIIKQRVSQYRLSLVHDSISWFDFEPTNGFRHVLSALLADKLFQSDISYSIVQLNAQAYKSLDFINPYLVLGTRWITACSLGPQAPVLMFAGIGVLPESGSLRGYRYGDLLGSQISAFNAELRFPLARNINYSLWPLDFLLLKDVQMVLFSDSGVVTNDLLHANSTQLRNSVGLGFRFHTFLLGKELLTIRFDISKITNSTSETYYTWGFGQAF
jgi:Tol biopolymer transport system component